MTTTTIPDTAPVLDVSGVGVTLGGRRVLHDVSFEAQPGEFLGLIGSNGAGKTTLLRIVSAQMRPSSGTAWVLGGQLGRTPMHDLRRQIGLVEPALGRRFYPEDRAIDVVLTGLTGTILLIDELPPDAPQRAQALLAAVGARELAERTFASCSEGERARIMLARGLIAEAPLLALDEPAAGLDLGGRELLLGAFEETIESRPGLTTVTVTHHLEELAPSVTHALLLREGRIVAAGPIDETLTDDHLSTCFGLALRIDRVAGRIFVRAV
jgi:iron complex transport system ATP-binding protein